MDTIKINLKPRLPILIYQYHLAHRLTSSNQIHFSNDTEF